MEIKRLQLGGEAEPDTDCIKLQHLPDGRVRLEGAALDGSESTAIVGDSVYDSEEEAEAAGLAWADALGVKTLYVSRGPA